MVTISLALVPRKHLFGTLEMYPMRGGENEGKLRLGLVYSLWKL